MIGSPDNRTVVVVVVDGGETEKNIIFGFLGFFQF